MRYEPAPKRLTPPPTTGGGVGAFLLPATTHRGRAKKKQLSLPVAVAPARVVEAEAESALPLHFQPLLPEKLRGMFPYSSSLLIAWQQAYAVAHRERRLLIRKRRLAELLAGLRTTRYRLEQHGLQVFRQLGTRTTLYRLADVLAIFVVTAAGGADGLTSGQIVADLERIIYDGLRETFGPEVHRKDLAQILGGAQPRDSVLASQALTPSISKHRCVLFSLRGLEKAVASLAPQKAESPLLSTGRMR